MTMSNSLIGQDSTFKLILCLFLPELWKHVHARLQLEAMSRAQSVDGGGQLRLSQAGFVREVNKYHLLYMLTSGKAR